MQLLFVHGLGATPFDFFLNARRLRQHGHTTTSFSYWAAFESLESIRSRLITRLTELSSKGDYAVIGHSLGGVLLRDTLLNLPDGVRPPRRLFLLGSPMLPTQANQYLNRFGFYRYLAGSCGQLVASASPMAAIGLPALPITCIAGTRGLTGRWSPFGLQANDSMVREVELDLARFDDVVRLPVRHPTLPTSAAVSTIICNRLAMPARGQSN